MMTYEHSNLKIFFTELSSLDYLSNLILLSWLVSIILSFYFASPLISLYRKAELKTTRKSIFQMMSIGIIKVISQLLIIMVLLTHGGNYHNIGDLSLENESILIVALFPLINLTSVILFVKKIRLENDMVRLIKVLQKKVSKLTEEVTMCEETISNKDVVEELENKFGQGLVGRFTNLIKRVNE